MKITEAIVLAGGLGTRLRSVVADKPKCLAEVAGQAFLYFVIHHLRRQGVERFIFSVGYLHEQIQDYVAEQFPQLDAVYCIEESPLGTGGAIRYACDYTSTENVIIVNGDTLFDVDIDAICKTHFLHDAETTLGLKRMYDFDRYGVVEVDGELITSFQEKKFYTTGLINGGVYVVNITAFKTKKNNGVFSFEKDYLEAHVGNCILFGNIQDVFFIDIGIPDDFSAAQELLKKYL
jgi:D-glycero-alpha-D-manno-heptose 1-phosphate guanylyltransferase